MNASSDLHARAAVLGERMTARLRLRHLRLLAALAGGATLHEAAAEVGVTQPAASQALREVEDLLELRLFERRARGLRTTEAGRFMCEQARQMLSGVGYAAQALASISLGLQRPLEVAAIPAALSSLVRPRLAQLRRRLAGRQLSFHEATPVQALAWLQGGVVQLALVRRPAQDPGGRLAFTELAHDELVVAGAPTHPATRRRAVALADLAAAPWSRPIGSTVTAQAFESACRAAGFEPLPADIQSMSPALTVPILEDGVTLVAAPRSILAPWLTAGELRPVRLREPIPLPPLGALHHEGEGGEAVRAVLEALGRR